MAQFGFRDTTPMRAPAQPGNAFETLRGFLRFC
jgi:hypothetical protein